MAVTLDDIRRASSVIKGQVQRTPCLRSQTLSQLTGADVHLKFENLQFTSSFKERGALNKLMSLTPEERKRGVIAMSAGNHAQGVAYHATRLGIPSTIVMPETTPFVKVKYTMAHGAHVIQKGMTLADCDKVAHDHRGAGYDRPGDARGFPGSRYHRGACRWWRAHFRHRHSGQGAEAVNPDDRG
jgi:threonine dehydratase